MIGYANFGLTLCCCCCHNRLNKLHNLPWNSSQNARGEVALLQMLNQPINVKDRKYENPVNKRYSIQGAICLVLIVLLWLSSTLWWEGLSKHHNQIGEVHTHSVTDFAAQSVESVGVFYPRSAAPAHHSTEHGTSLTQNTQNTSSDTY